MGNEVEHQTSPLRNSSLLMEHLKPGIALGRCQMGCCYQRHLMPEGQPPPRAQHAHLAAHLSAELVTARLWVAGSALL